MNWAATISLMQKSEIIFHPAYYLFYFQNNMKKEKVIKTTYILPQKKLGRTRP